MTQIDKRGKLQEKPFTFRETKDGKVFLYWHGKQIMILKEKKAESFLKKIVNASEEQSQLLMAKVTGHFKHGNER
jgi:hypothetical protein